ncbi:MAG: hypothetical protein ACRD7E_13040, partial [Bryobacteraceae bacterium]
VMAGMLGLSTALAPRAHSQSPSPRVTKPFVAHERTVHISAGQGETRITRGGIFARRSDGSFMKMHEVSSPAGEIGQAVEIVDLRNRKVIILEPFTRLTMTFYRSDAEMREELKIQGTCMS